MSTSIAIPPELVERVIEVTGTGEAEAAHLLGACANDVEAAIALYFEQGNENDVQAVAAANDGNNVAVDDDNVRAPIAPVREQLIRPEDDNFYVAAAPPLPSTGRIAHTSQRVKVCPLRDFAREGALMEQELQQAAGDVIEGFAPPVDSFEAFNQTRNRIQARTAAMVNAAKEARANSRLGDLFRPPTDISYIGSFQTARHRATHLKSWLLVNVQNDNFNSQVLNRDVWANKDVRKLLRRRFMLWQVDSDSSEGRRFVTFYHCAKIPYLCVIDPRTGEEIWRSPEPKQANVLTDLKKFVQENKDFSTEIGDDMPTTSKRPTSIIDIVNDDDDDDDDDDKKAIGTSKGPIKKRSKVMELSEEEQVALAIRNSMHENGVKTNGRSPAKKSSTSTSSTATTASSAGTDDLSNIFGNDSDNSDEEFCDDDTKSACEERSYEEELGKGIAEQTMIKLRLLNEEGNDEATTLRWPSDTKLKVLRLYIAQKHSHIPKQGYKIICAFPRKTLDVEHDEATLKEFGLHPSANLHVTIDD